MINSAREIAQNMAESAMNAEADAALEFETAVAQEAAAAEAAETSALEDAQAANEVLQALDQTMAATAKIAGFTSGLKGTVAQAEGGGVSYTADASKFVDLEDGSVTTDTFFYSSLAVDGSCLLYTSDAADE